MMKKWVMIILRLLPSLLLLYSPQICVAEDGGDGNDDDNNNNEDYTKVELCSDSSIQVTGLSIYCDSPGTFYYGSGKYRNSESCKGGDRAKVSITFDILEDGLQDPLFTLIANGDEKISVYKNARLCYLGTLKSSSNDGTSCPGAGSYSLSTQFYWSVVDDDDSINYASRSSFDPVLSVGFHSDKNPEQYDLGGANTDKCQGNTEEAWTKNVDEAKGRGPLASILWSFGIFVFTLALLAAFAWYLVWRRPTDNFARYYSQDAQVDDDRKLQFVGSNRGLVDF